MGNNNILGLPPINANFGSGFNTVGSNPESQALSKSEIKETNQDSIRRRLAVDIIAANNEHAIQRFNKMDQNAYVAYFKSTQFIIEMSAEAQGTPYQKYTDAFADRLVKVSAHCTFGLLEVGAQRMAFEVNRPPLPDDSPKGFLGFLLG